MSMSPEELLTEYSAWVTRKKIAGADVSPGAFLHERYLEALRRAMIRYYHDTPATTEGYLDEEFHDRLAEDATALPVGSAVGA